MRRIRLILLAVTVLALAVLACGGVDETPTQEPPPIVEVQPTAEAQPTAEMEPTVMPTNTSEPVEGISIEVTNDSGVDIWYIFLSPTDADQWGEDWLGGEVIPDGETYTVTGIPEGVYDVKAASEDGETIEVWWDVEIDGDMTWNVAGTVSLDVVNNFEDAISYLYISPVASDSWGDDWLGDDVIAAGESYTVNGIPQDTYDIKATDADDNVIETVYAVEILEANEWTVNGKTPLPSNAVLRFEDEFEDNRNNWGLDTEGEDVFYQRPADGEYCILIKRENFTAWEWYEPFRTDEFVAEVACSITGAEDASCGLGFGPDGDNIYWYEISPADQAFALFLLEDDAWQDNLVDWTLSKNINPTGTNYLSMQRMGGVVSLFVNGILVEEVESDRFPTGRVGLGGSTYEEGNATVCLDNLRVWRLE